MRYLLLPLYRRVAVSLCLALSTVRLAVAQSMTLAADASVTSGHSTTNYGALSNLYVGNGATAFLRFDLGTLPASVQSSQVSRATLRLYVNRVNASGIVSVQPVTSSWDEASITQTAVPTYGAAVEIFAASQEGQFVTVDVTSTVQGWIANPTTNFGVALTAGSADAVFDSKENDETAHPAELQIVLTNVGPQGPQGLKGDKGDTGLQGPQGAVGPGGAVGPVGPDGAVGAMGAQGLPGAPGATGAQGSTGPAGRGDMVFQGAYASANNYALNDVVSWQNAAWISLADSNHGNTPSESPVFWQLFLPAAVGSQGATGATGAAGPQGAQGDRGFTGEAGAQGATGATVATGKPGFVYQGIYQSTGNYVVGDVVLWQGGSWASLVDGNRGNTPSESPSFWVTLTSQGPQGVAGTTGATGAQGLQGMQGQTGA